MRNLNYKKMIADVVAKNRQGVINALGRANIQVTDAISDKELYELVMYELEKGNPDVILHLGDVLTETFDWSTISEEIKSNTTGALTPSQLDAISQAASQASANQDPSWWSKNKDNVWNSALSVGTSWLGNLFGKKDNPPKTVTPPAGGGNTAQMMLMMQQQEAARRAAEERRRREEADRRRSNNMIFAIVGGVLVVGTIITVIAMKGGKK